MPDTNNCGNSILVQLTLDKVRCFDSENVGSWIDSIVTPLKAANVAAEQIYAIIYQAIPESGQKQIHFEEGEAKNIETLKQKLKALYDQNPTIKTKAYINNYSLGGKTASLYAEELCENLGQNSSILGMCFLNVVPEKIKQDVRNKLLNQEDLKAIAAYVDKYINTYLKDDQALYEIRNEHAVKKVTVPYNNTHEQTTSNQELKHSVDFIKIELDNQKRVNDELLSELRKIKTEMPLLVNSIQNLNMQGNNYDNGYDRQPRSQSRNRYNSQTNRDHSRPRFYDHSQNNRDHSRPRAYDNNNICYGHKKFGNRCHKDRCQEWCQYNEQGNKAAIKQNICYGHKRYGDRCFPEKCPAWCIKNTNSKNLTEVSTQKQQ